MIEAQRENLSINKLIAEWGCINIQKRGTRRESKT